MKFFKLTSFLFAILILFSTGCSSNNDAQESSKEAVLVYIQWDEGVAYTHLAQSVLEHKMDFEVTLLSAHLEPAYKMVAEEEADAFMESWHPVLHRSYLQKYGDSLTDLGSVVDSTKSGLVVPSYVPVDSIKALGRPSVRKKLSGRITGIEEGAGIMNTTREVLKRYDLSYELQSSSNPAMTAAIKRAILNEDWIVATGWKPHWMLAKWNLKFLHQDPDKKLWTEGSIHIMGSKDIEEQKPKLAAFLRNMKLTEKQLYDLMLKIEEQKDKEVSDITRKWMNRHPALIEDWIPEK